ncbi:TolC family protein (plasmid) [Sphingomonas paeninsulae]|jgi:cobalt-zinc-cadmium efflux system outer membrane protein|uniref:TolC family protein n=1 Tax=Sphingomonas paeninsulae TaxID=2319844 RepID=A0A494TBK1_SPHPE|nr:TolC family protein [Sphingomonas paeninsulae]AYJ84792.1 TolC family protein [Sphingomonas paeninsulae]
MHRFFAALLAVSGCASIAQAQSTDPAHTGPSLTLDKALDLAGATSPSIQVASAGIRSTDAARTIAGLRPNPSIVTQTENVTGSGQYRGLRSAETTVGLELPVELGGKRSARIAVAGARGQRAVIAAAVARADVRLAVTQSYIEAIAAERRLTTAGEQSGIATGALRAARVRVKAGRASPMEEQRAEVVRINAEAAVERATRTQEVARGNLARRIGQPITGKLDLAWFDRVSGYGPTQLIDPGSTLTMTAARADVATADAQVGLARSQRIPDIRLSAGARRLAATNDTAAVFGVSIPFPIFNNGSAAIAQARAERDQSDAMSRVIAIETAQAIAASEAEVANAAMTALTASGPALVAAQEAARIARIGYREGKFGQLDLLDAERTLSEIRAAAIDALAAYHDAQARRDRLTTAAPDLTRD